MKKVLLGTSAIALAGAVAGQASAAEWNMVVGGYAISYLAYMQTDRDNPTVGQLPLDLDGVDVFWDGEIHFKPSITLDNGIKIGANVQLEARASAATGITTSATAGGAITAVGLSNPGTGDIIDEAYLFVEGSFGRILMGDENSAGSLMTYGAPNRSGIGVNSPQTFFVPLAGAGDTSRGTLGSTYLENSRNNDSGRISYFTPRFAGFQVGVSYARDATQNTAGFQNIAQSRISDIIDIAANYQQTFGDFSVGASARWGIATDNRTAVGPFSTCTAAGATIGDCGEDPTVLGFGLNLGYAGFSIGGSWAEQNGDGNRDGTAYEVGVAYDTGPWGFSFNYFHGENVDNENVGNGGVPIGAAGALGVDETIDHYQLGVLYRLAKGTNLHLAAGYVEFDEEFGAGITSPTAGNDIDGFYIATGIRVSF